MGTENKQTFIPITPDLLDGTKNARGKEVVLSTGQVLQRIQFADFVKELNLEENSFEFKAITPASPAPTKTGLYFPMSAGKYANFGNIEITEEQFDSSFIFIVFDGTGFQMLIKPVDFIPTGKIEENEINAVSGGEVFNIHEMKDVYSNVNIADSRNIKQKQWINASGEVISSTSLNQRVLLNIPIDNSKNDFITISGYTPEGLKKLVFRNINGAVVGSVRELKTEPITFALPKDMEITIDISVTLKSSDIFDEFQINYGNAALPFEPFYSREITSILGAKIKSGKSFNQDLNTTNDVEFNSVKTKMLEYTAYSFNLPKGNGVPPLEVEVGDAWVDENDSSIKVKMT